VTILVTGGLGAIGSWVTRELSDRGERPVVFDSRQDESLVRDLGGRYDLVVGDLLDLPSLYRIAVERRVDRIIHLAAVMPPFAQANPYQGFRVNAEGTVGILEVARALRVKRLVYTSSKAVYQPMTGPYGYPEYRPITEEYPIGPDMVYGVAKLAGELMALQYRREFGLDVITLRLASTYGPGKVFERHGAVSIVSRMIDHAMLGKPLRLPQGGDEKNDFIYNRDVAQAVVLACTALGTEHHVFNIGTGTGRALKELVSVLNARFPTARIEVGPGLDYLGNGMQFYSVSDIARARAELGFTPRYPVERGIEDYVETVERLGLGRVLERIPQKGTIGQ
jgi:UDP-glucose 4-epimerase